MTMCAIDTPPTRVQHRKLPRCRRIDENQSRPCEKRTASAH
jgi:hypothetical protein